MNLSGAQQPSSTQQDGVMLSVMHPADYIAKSNDDFALEEITEQVQTSSTTLPSQTLSLLETRLHSMTGIINSLNLKNRELRQIIKERNSRIAHMETERDTLEQQLQLFTSTNVQVIDGLADLLNRFSGGKTVHTSCADEEDAQFEPWSRQKINLEEALILETNLLEKTLGNA